MNPPPRALVVDDSRLTRTIIKNALTGAGYDIVGEAVNGREGIEMAEKLKPDLVTVDLTMPEKGGLESLDELRVKNPRGKVIVVTALGSQKLLQEDALKAGALAMINKPFNPFELVRVADKLLRRESLTAAEPRSLVLPMTEAFPETIGGKLTPNQLNDLMEVGNIGAGHAASRLSDLISRRCLISPPQVAFLKTPEIVKALTKDDFLLASMGIKVLGDIPAVMVVVLRKDQAAALVKHMTGGILGGDKEKGFTAPVGFALKQVGEFLTRAFSQAVGQFLADKVQKAFPDVSLADSPKDLDALLKEGGNGGQTPHLLIHCGFSDVEKSFDGKLSYILSPESQRTVLARLRTILSRS